MSKLTKRQRADVSAALAHLDRGIAFLYGDRVSVAVRDTHATTTLHFTRADGRALYEIAKDIGSDLTGIQEARRRLAQFLEPVAVAAE